MFQVRWEATKSVLFHRLCWTEGIQFLMDAKAIQGGWGGGGGGSKLLSVVRQLKCSVLLGLGCVVCVFRGHSG